MNTLTPMLNRDGKLPDDHWFHLVPRGEYPHPETKRVQVIDDTALTAMRQARVRRLPVVGFGGVLLGILSINDILLAAGAGKEVESEDVVQTLQAICAHHHPVPHVVAA